MTALLELRGLAKTFPLAGGATLFAVDGVGLSIAPGEAVGLVGESGCGKSTLAQLIARLLDPTAGEILVEGADVARVPAARFARHPLRRRVQLVFQDAHEALNPAFTAFRSIADPVLRLSGPLGSAAVRARVEAAAEAIGLPLPLLERYPHQLSGGQKARVGIARAIVCEPALLILDEPTASLDVSVQATILKELDRLRRARGLAMLFVSHDLNVVRMLCDRVVVMYLGRMVETGPAARVFNAPAHPYTRALIDAIPSLAGRPGPARTRLAGEPGSPVDPDPAACRFQARCPLAQDLCRRAMPPLMPQAEPAQLAACHFPLRPGAAPGAPPDDHA